MMELALSSLTLFFTDMRFDYWELMSITLLRLVKFLEIIARCFIIPVTYVRRFLSHRRRCPPIKNDLLLLPGSILARKIRRKEVTSEEVIKAYVERCREVNPILNAIVEDRFDAAIQEAREIDLFLRSTMKTEEEINRDTPLLGVPVTIKESIGVQGMSQAVGNVLLKNRKAEDDAEVVKMVRKAGGVLLLVSNTPEFCMFWETYNSLTGRTCNPYDPLKTAGGSSGGESALLASAASLLGVCSDVAGSARLPAMFCSVFGHKPTPGWVPSKGHKPQCTDEKWDDFFTVGTMVRYAEDLPLMLKVLCRTEKVSRFDEKVHVKNLKFYYMEVQDETEALNIDVEIKYAIHQLKQHIEDTHNVRFQKIDLKEMRHALIMSGVALLSIDGVETVFGESGKQNVHFLEIIKYLCGLSPHLFSSVFYVTMRKIAQYLPRSYKRNLTQKAMLLKKQFQEYLKDNGVFVYPTFASGPHYHHEIYHKVHSISYMMVFNLLGMPVTQCPMGFNRSGLPIGLQIVANPGCDHLTVAVAKEIEKAFGGWKQPRFHSQI